MAQWTLNAGCYFRPFRKFESSPRIRSFQCSTCASTATIKAGYVVTSDTVVSTGGLRLVRAPSSGGQGANLFQVGITSLIGIAAEADTSSGSTAGLSDPNVRKIPVYLADGNTEWLGYCKGNGVIGSTMVGEQKAIIFDSTLQTYFIDSTNSTAALMAVTITDVPDYSLGSTNGPVVFRFLSTLASPVIK
jgi:hypothetical protein